MRTFAQLLLTSALGLTSGMAQEISLCQPYQEQIEILQKCDGACVTSTLKEKTTDELLQSYFSQRLEAKAQLSRPEMKVCGETIKELLVLLREKSDYVGAIKYPQMKIADIDYSTVNPVILKHEGYPDFFLNPAFNDFKFEQGDVIITKGISLVSSSITSFAAYRSPFSHIVFLYIDPETNDIKTIESYIGQGVSFFSITEAMMNENARIMVLRAKDKNLAEKAALHMGERVKDAMARDTYIPYDYKFDFSDDSALSCEEVAYSSLKFSSDGQVVIPEFTSVLDIKNEELKARLNIGSGPMMLPSDMESDSRFEVVLDWTDFRIIRDSWIKDAMMQVIMEAMNEGEFRLPETFASRAARLVWKGRKVRWLWPLLSKISGIPRNTTPDVPAMNIATIASFKKVQALYLPDMQEADEEYFATHGRWADKSFLVAKMRELIDGKTEETVQAINADLN